jgi:hypothetical protein
MKQLISTRIKVDESQAQLKVVETLISEGWRVQEWSYRDAPKPGLKGRSVSEVYLERLM